MIIKLSATKQIPVSANPVIFKQISDFSTDHMLGDFT